MELEDVHLTQVGYSAGRSFRTHDHEAAFFCVLLGGAYDERIGSRHLRYAPRSVVFHPPGTTHRDRVGGGGARLFGVTLGKTWLDRLRRTGAEPSLAVDDGRGELSWLSLRLHRAWQAPGPGASLAVEGLLLEMLATLAREERMHPGSRMDLVRKAAEVLGDRYQQPPTIAELARILGVGAVSLARAFRRVRGQTIAGYVRALRVREAGRLLANPRLRLCEIAALAGFADQSHFTRAFRQTTGFTPGRVRASVDLHQAVAAGKRAGQ